MLSHIALPLALATVPVPSRALEEIPFQRFEERFEQIRTLELQYRTISATGQVAEIRLAYASPHLVHVEIDTGEQQVEVWTDAEESTWLVTSPEGQQAWTIDFERTFGAAQNWHWQFREDVLGRNVDRVSHVTTTLKIWPAAEPGKSWTVDLSSGVRSGPGPGLTLDWLEQLRRLDADAEFVENGWRIELGGGERLVLDPDLGHLVRALIDPNDPDRGSLTLSSVVIDAELTENEFDAEIAAEIELTDGPQASMRATYWVQHRTFSLVELAHFEREELDQALASASFEELMGTYFRERFADQIARTEARIGGFAEERARLIQEFLDENGGSDRARAEAAEAGRQLRLALANWSDEVGRDLAATGIELPELTDAELDSEALADITAREEEIAVEAIREHLTKRLTARIEGVIGDLGKAN